MSTQAFWWLALLVGFLACLIVPAALFEWYARSDYRQFVRHMRALAAQRAEYVPPVREYTEHRPTIVRQGQVR